MSDKFEAHFGKGVKVMVTPHLPIEGTVQATCLETKQEVTLSTGKMIHVFTMQLNGKLHGVFVSQEYYDKIKEGKNGR